MYCQWNITQTGSTTLYSAVEVEHVSKVAFYIVLDILDLT